MVYVDTEPDTADIDAAKIEAAITPRMRAIMPVSLYGQPADMDEINSIAAAWHPVIEDAAQSFGATHKGRKSCALSTIGATSFLPSKCAVLVAKLERFEWEVADRARMPGMTRRWRGSSRRSGSSKYVLIGRACSRSTRQDRLARVADRTPRGRRQRICRSVPKATNLASRYDLDPVRKCVANDRVAVPAKPEHSCSQVRRIAATAVILSR